MLERESEIETLKLLLSQLRRMQFGRKSERLERQIERLTQREAALGAEMADHAADYERLTKLGADRRSVQADKADLEERWLTVAGELDG